MSSMPCAVWRKRLFALSVLSWGLNVEAWYWSAMMVWELENPRVMIESVTWESGKCDRKPCTKIPFPSEDLEATRSIWQVHATSTPSQRRNVSVLSMTVSVNECECVNVWVCECVSVCVCVRVRVRACAQSSDMVVDHRGNQVHSQTVQELHARECYACEARIGPRTFSMDRVPGQNHLHKWKKKTQNLPQTCQEMRMLQTNWKKQWWDAKETGWNNSICKVPAHSVSTSGVCSVSNFPTKLTPDLWNEAWFQIITGRFLKILKESDSEKLTALTSDWFAMARVARAAYTCLDLALQEEQWAFIDCAAKNVHTLNPKPVP